MIQINSTHLDIRIDNFLKTTQEFIPEEDILPQILIMKEIIQKIDTYLMIKTLKINPRYSRKTSRYPRPQSRSQSREFRSHSRESKDKYPQFSNSKTYETKEKFRNDRRNRSQSL